MAISQCHPTESLLDRMRPTKFKEIDSFQSNWSTKNFWQIPKNTWRISRIASSFGYLIWRSMEIHVGYKEASLTLFAARNISSRHSDCAWETAPKHLGPGIKDVTNFNKCDVHSVLHKFWSHKKVLGLLIPCQVQGVWLRITTATF